MKKVMMIALAVMPLSAFAAPPLPLNFSCGSTGGVYSDGHGGVWLGGKPTTVKQHSANYWEAQQGKVVIGIARLEDGNPSVTFTGPGRANGTCLPEDERSFAPASAKAATTATTTQGPSFSCKGVAEGSMEQRVCNSPELSALDRQMSKTWSAALAKSGGDKNLKASQRGWIKGRDECWKETDHDACIKREYQQRIGELQKTYGVK